MTVVVLIGTTVFALDRLSKAAVVRSSRGVLRLAAGDGVGRGFGGSPSVLIGLWVMAVAAAIVLVESGQATGVAAGVALGVALGGAAGNLLDRARRRPVFDFIDVGLGAVFNIADVAIVVGVAASLVLVL